MVNLALQILHFESFLNRRYTNIEIATNEMTYLKNFSKDRSKNPMIENYIIKFLFDDYEEYKKDTLNGNTEKRLNII